MGAFKLGKMTFGSLFKKPETVLYPIEKKPQPKGLKGHIAIDVSTCILCGACDRGCPADCITVDKSASTWSIDRLGCIQCGYCITVCPKTCLAMDPDYAAATTVHVAESFDIPKQEKLPKATEPAVVDAKPELEPQDSDGVKPASEVVSDAQLAKLIELLDGDKADKVRIALKK